MNEPPDRLAQVRLLMPLVDADALAKRLTGVPRTPTIERVLDQLWLRSALIEQWRRTILAERADFEGRANRILGALDPEFAGDARNKKRQRVIT
jgi:hypothetical protein